MPRPLVTTQNQSQEHHYTQQCAKNAKSHSVKFTDKREPQTDRTENYPFFERTKITQNIDT